jgi:glycosyltransferase involved in cell wall biosynthesis
MVKGLVSIITACYNGVQFIEQAIKSVLAQSYPNWEMIIVDDCSVDNSVEIISSYQKKDRRIRLYQTGICSGSPIEPRNIGIEKASGQFIAFLDSDDIWLPNKLENQIKLFDDKNVGIVYSNYEKISESGVRNNRTVKAQAVITYEGLLRSNCIGCLTAIYNVAMVGKVYFEQFHHEDYVLWLTILRTRCIAKNTNTIEALYRIRKKSISSNKFIALSWTWKIYRDFLKLSFSQSIYYIVLYFFMGLLKYLK